jgi:hypothetical protein
MTCTYFFGGKLMAKKLGVFYNGKEWIMGTDVNNGACCETKEIAEQLLALHNKYYSKQVLCDLGEPYYVIGKVVEVGLAHTDNGLVPNLYIRHKRAKWIRPADECELL